MSKSYSYEVALDMLTEGLATGARSKMVRDSEFSTQSFRTASTKQFEKAKHWTPEDGVQGFGIANKVTEGKKTEDLALKIYVDRKRPLSQIDNPAPKTVDLPAIGKLTTDVEEIGVIKPELYTTRADPLIPGCGVIHNSVADDVGTFGCVVVKSDGSDIDEYVLSNAHVLADSGLAAIDTNILQPGTMDGGIAPDNIGELASFVPFDFHPELFANKVDAAIARLDPSKRQISRNIRILNHPPLGVGSVIRRGMKVQKVGRTTDHTWGEILDVNFRFNMSYPSPAHGNTPMRAGFKDQVICTRFTDSGDSGSAVLSNSGKLIGLHFAGSRSASVFNKIGNVFESLQIKLPD